MRRARRPGGEEAAVPLSSRHHGLFYRDCGLQRELQILPELGYFPVAPRADSGRIRSAQRVAELAAQYHCPTIAYTYSEPVVFSEFLMDTADAGHEAGIRSIVVSNGYIQDEALRAAYGKMDAVKIDLKAFSESFYSKIVTGQLKPVLDTSSRCARWASGQRSSTW